MKKNVSNLLVDYISGIFHPIINLLSAAGILKGILAILTASELLSLTGGTYLVFNAMADSMFYFLPMMLAYTSAKKFGANPFTAMVIAGVLLYPALTTVFDSGADVIFAGLPMKSVTYHSSVIPIILAVGLLVFVEKFFNRLLPDTLKGLMTPVFSIVFVGLVTLFVFGPFGSMIGNVLAKTYEIIYNMSPALAGLLLGAFMQPMVIFGFHWSFIFIAMNNISLLGSDTVLTFMGPPVFAQAGAAFAVYMKSKDKNFKSTCISAVLSACLGITEPAMFGVNLPRKKPMAAVCMGGAIGGTLAGISGAQASAFAFPGLATLPIFIGDGFGLYVISCFAGFLTAFLLSMFFKYDVEKKELSN